MDATPTVISDNSTNWNKLFLNARTNLLVAAAFSLAADVQNIITVEAAVRHIERELSDGSLGYRSEAYWLAASSDARMRFARECCRRASVLRSAVFVGI